MLRYFDSLQKKICTKDLSFSLSSATPYISREHFIYVYSLEKSLPPYYPKNISNKDGVFVDEEIEKALSNRSYSDNTAKKAEVISKLFRKAEQFNPPLFDKKEIDPVLTSGKKVTAIRLSTYGEDFTKFSELLNYILKNYKHIWIFVVTPFLPTLLYKIMDWALALIKN